ncbi:MAG TPA: carbamoyltransferase C-terminal domain-containing protein [Nitrospirales bacterium]|nr:carbamoyltransferase C-terminal domain-containing protein [Nitrospirales bacterium]
MLTLGLLNMRDAAAAIAEDGRLIAAAEEERFVRIKHVTALPLGAIRYCLREAGVRLSDVDAIAVPWKYWQVGRRAALALGAMLRSPLHFRVKARRSAERMTQEWMELATLRRRLSRALEVACPAPTFYDHHMSHAASALLTSPFERAAILVVDGASEAHTTLLAHGEGTRLRPLRRIALPHSLGQFYAAITAYLGFRPDYDEYIVMGLAAYGEPTFADALRRTVLPPTSDGGFRLNTALFDFHLARVGIFTPEFVRLFGPPRRRDEPIEQRHRDLAASAQLVLEETLLQLARELKRLTRADDLCVAGGVALNCVANSRLARESGFARVYVPPSAGDGGTPVGAVLWHAARRGIPRDRIPALRTAAWGPRFETGACRDAATRAGLPVEAMSDEALCERVAAELVQGKLVLWFQGRMEWGARALGHRSLLADPRREDIRELINARVKLREPFRPFAPSVLEERAFEFFDLPAASPFMSFTCPVWPSAKGLVPAVVHVDGTARVQTVGREADPRFRRLLEAFAKLTGVPVLLNTSFNVNEPIVCTPEDAVACYLKSQVEWLVMENLLIGRPPRS